MANLKNLDFKLKKIGSRQVLIISDLGKSKADFIYNHYANGKNGNGKYEVEIRPDEDDGKKYAVAFKIKDSEIKNKGVNKNA